MTKSKSRSIPLAFVAMHSLFVFWCFIVAPGPLPINVSSPGYIALVLLQLLIDLPVYLLLLAGGVVLATDIKFQIALFFVFGGIQWWFIGVGVAWVLGRLKGTGEPIASSVG